MSLLILCTPCGHDVTQMVALVLNLSVITHVKEMRRYKSYSNVLSFHAFILLLEWLDGPSSTTCPRFSTLRFTVTRLCDGKSAP